MIKKTLLIGLTVVGLASQCFATIPTIDYTNLLENVKRYLQEGLMYAKEGSMYQTQLQQYQSQLLSIQRAGNPANVNKLPGIEEISTIAQIYAGAQQAISQMAIALIESEPPMLT